jgi:hypothetical protein
MAIRTARFCPTPKFPLSNQGGLASDYDGLAHKVGGAQFRLSRRLA